MALYLDSAGVEDARRAADLGFVAGATTNPALLAQAGRPADQVIADLGAVLPGTIFCQVTTPPAEPSRCLPLDMRRLHVGQPMERARNVRRLYSSSSDQRLYPLTT